MRREHLVTLLAVVVSLVVSGAWLLAVPATAEGAGPLVRDAVRDRVPGRWPAPARGFGVRADCAVVATACGSLDAGSAGSFAAGGSLVWAGWLRVAASWARICSSRSGGTSLHGSAERGRS